jgi:large subunit ribosomal protein L22
MSTTEFTARHRFAGITARKARRIADMIRGRSVNEALDLLQFAPQRGAAFYLKVVRSAVANASLDEDVNINDLVISDCRADDGPLLSGRMRFRPGPQGRAMPFAKRLSHLTVKLTTTDDTGDAPKKKGAKAKRSRTKSGASQASETTSSATAVASEEPAQKPRKKSAAKAGKKKTGGGEKA